jgi:hypothetical protein
MSRIDRRASMEPDFLAETYRPIFLKVRLIQDP